MFNAIFFYLVLNVWLNVVHSSFEIGVLGMLMTILMAVTDEI